jgi:hypothetical protein
MLSEYEHIVFGCLVNIYVLSYLQIANFPYKMIITDSFPLILFCLVSLPLLFQTEDAGFLGSS